MVETTLMQHFAKFAPLATNAWIATDLQKRSEDVTLESARTLEQFLASVEKRAFKIANFAVRDPDDALDIVQDAMLQLARRYAHLASAQWQPLFYRILQNRVRDYQRQRTLRKKIFGWFPGLQFGQATDSDARDDELEAVVDTAQEPQERVVTDQAMCALELALQQLPARQLQAFLLRTMEGMDVAATAQAMGCTQGSVKTHYSRAVHALRARLGDVW
jgi:RNA polymerase sigma-70 factor, ECF subfamily